MPVVARLLGVALLLQAVAAHGAGSGSVSRLISDAEALSSVDSTAAGRLLTHSIGTLESTFFWKSSKKETDDPWDDEPPPQTLQPTTAAPTPEPSPEPSPEPTETEASTAAPAEAQPPAQAEASTTAPTAGQQVAASTVAADTGDDPERSARSPTAPKGKAPRELPADWPEPRRRELVEQTPQSCTSNKGKRRGVFSRTFGFGDNSYQQKVDALGERCNDYAKVQKSAQKKRTEIEKLSTDLSNLNATRDEWLNGIREARKEITRKGKAIEQVARLIEEHEKEHGKSLLQNQSLLQNPLPASTTP